MKTKSNKNPDFVKPIPTMSKMRIIKNVVVLSTGVMFLFIAYDGLTMLQSTMNSEQGIGVICQAVLYVCFCVSALVLPKYVIKKLGSKLTLVLSMLSYIPYVGSNFYPHWSVMMPTSILIGFGAALLWGSQANYINDVSVLYAELLLVSEEKDPEIEKGNVVVGDKKRRPSNNGCRCISCVYVEYDGTDSCPLEDQLRGSDKDTKLSQKRVASFEVSELGHPLSSSECRSSCNVENQSSVNRKHSIQKPELIITEHFYPDRMAGGKDHSEPNQNISSKTKVDSESTSCSNLNISGNHSEMNSKDSIPKTKEHGAMHLDSTGVKDNSELNMNMSSKPDRRSSCKIENCSKQNINGSIPKNNADHSQLEDGNSEPDEKLSSKPKVDSECRLTCKNVKQNKKNTNNSIFNKTDHSESVYDNNELNQNLSPKPKVHVICRSSCEIENHSKQNHYNSIPKNNAYSSDSADDNNDPNKKMSSETKVINTKSHLNRSRAIESTTARFFGFLGLAFLSSAVWSNLLSYYVLQVDDRHRNTSSLNDSFIKCGAEFCGFESADQIARHMPSDTARFALTGVCVCLGLAAVLFIALFLDPLDDKTGDGFSLQLLMATFRVAKRTELLLLMPLSMYLGMAKGFFAGDFTKAFVGCALGPSHVSLVAVCYGTSCALCSLFSGWVVQRTGRPALFAVSALVNASSCALLLAWTPNAERPIIFFVAVGMWGFQVGSVWSQIRAFYGVLFKADEEAAFATFHTWFSLGFCVSFAYSNFLCTALKVYLLLAVSTVGYVGYFVVERRHATGKIQNR